MFQNRFIWNASVTQLFLQTNSNLSGYYSLITQNVEGEIYSVYYRFINKFIKLLGTSPILSTQYLIGNGTNLELLVK